MASSSPRKFACRLRSKYWENEGYEGHYQFNKEQYYDGEFFRDSLHGQGTYKWQDFAVYEGGFYSNSKEGYACLSFPDNSYFEGLFIKNQPFGPGILTYSNGRQDAGFWVGRNLVRLSRAIDFIIPRLAPTSAGKIKLLQFRRLIPLEDNNDSSADMLKKYEYLSKHFSTLYSSLIYDTRSVFFDRQTFEKAYFVNVSQLSKLIPENWENSVRMSGDVHNIEEELFMYKESPDPPHCICPQDVFEMRYKETEDTDICERESFKGESEMGILGYFTKYGVIDEPNQKNNEENFQGESFDAEEEEYSNCPKILSWNRSALFTEMLKQIFRFRAFEEKLHFSLGKLMIGDRTAFRKTGEKEMQCIHFLKMCSLGPPHVVRDLLCSYEISEELMDARGNNSLMFAAACDQHDVIDILLNYGVDVNTFNDESLTPLNLCLLRRLAQTEGISNWETAFLPKEIDRTLASEYPPQREWQSVTSLDRIFGDGMSIFDSKLDKAEEYVNFSLPSLLREAVESFQRFRDLDESANVFNLSDITILNIPNSPGTYSLVPSGPRMLRRSTNPSIFHGLKESDGKNISHETTRTLDLVPQSHKTEEFEKSIRISSTDRYLFDYSFDKTPQEGEGKKDAKGSLVKEDESVDDMQELDKNLVEKLAKIDKTIEILLQRGADPNISEVPKPSIHLGVHTKDLNIVLMLLQHGANPDSRLYSNEGLLTPLHVVVLQKPAPEYVDICDLLLNFGANPNEETTPEFTICEDEKKFLDPECGRTPLQLLCMRPDLEYAHPEECLISIALMLSKVSKLNKFYNGHSYLTLAMLCGNIKLLKALLESGKFDSNEILEKSRGTSLHFLVSSELQKRTSYDKSIKMCDLLIANNADPLKEVSSLGNCVEYGYREIEEEKQARKAKNLGRKDSKSERTSRDHLKDHEKVVDYLGKIASDMATGKKKGKQSGRSDKMRKSQDSLTETFPESSITDGKTGRKIGEGKDRTDRTENTGGEGKKKNPELQSSRENREKKEGEPEGKDKKGQIKKEESAGKTKTSVQDKPTRTKKNKSKKYGAETKEKSKSKKPRKQFKQVKMFQDKEKDMRKPWGKAGPNLQRLSKASTRYLETCSETFPEKQRQILLRMFGNCTDIDINEFLVPYVVLRDGELYYRFQGKVTQSKEQYSLI